MCPLCGCETQTIVSEHSFQCIECSHIYYYCDTCGSDNVHKVHLIAINLTVVYCNDCGATMDE